MLQLLCTMYGVAVFTYCSVRQVEDTHWYVISYENVLPSAPM